MKSAHKYQFHSTSVKVNVQCDRSLFVPERHLHASFSSMSWMLLCLDVTTAWYVNITTALFSASYLID